jgi:hypothetical protein
MDEAVVLVPEMWVAFPALARTAALAWACAPGQRGGRGGGSGIFVISSATADSSLPITRVIWS